MSHLTVISGTAYAVTGAKTYVSATGYDIPQGSISDAGTARDILFVQYIETVPSQSGTLTYTGSAQSPTWANYDSTQLTLSGTTSSTNAGNYSATFTPKSGFAWSDGSTGAKTVTWSIGKAAGSISLSASSVSVKTGKSVSFTVSRNGDGAISVSNSYTSYITTTVSGTRVTVKGIAAAGAPLVITVNVAAGTNHTAVSKSITVSVSDPVTYWVQFGSNAKYITDAGTMSSATTYFEEGTRIQIVYPFNTDFVDKPSFEVDGQTVSVYTFTAKNEFGNSMPVYGCYYTVNKNTHAMFYYSVMYISAA